MMRHRRLPVFGVAIIALSLHYPTAQAQQGQENTPHEITGIILKINDSRITIQTRSGAEMQVDASAAIERGRATPPVVGALSILRERLTPRACCMPSRL
jgi:hypothetical protein